MTENTAVSTPPIFVRDRQVKEFFGISPSQARRLSEAGLFAKRRRIGTACTGYFYDEGRDALLKNAKTI